MGMTNAFLVGDRVFLRGIQTEDATDAYLSWLNDPEITKGLVSGTHPTTRRELHEYIDAAVRNPNTVMFAVCDREEDLHIGNIKIDSFDWSSRVAELGILIGDQRYWGKGIGSEACQLVLRYAFDTLNLRKVELCVFSNNPAAMKLYEKLGFKLEGTLRQHVFRNGSYWDKHYMGIFKEELNQ